MNPRKPPPRPAGRIARLLRLALLAAAALAPVAVVSAAPGARFFPFNAPADPQAPRISALDVVPVAQLAPGAQLRFELRGTPGAEASLRIDGAYRVLGLAEVAPGQYRGTYTVGTADRIEPDATVVGNLRRGEQLGLAMLTGPLTGPITGAITGPITGPITGRLPRDIARPRLPA